MAYATFADLSAIYSLGLLERLCLRAGDPDVPAPADVETRCQMALDSSAGMMDSYFVAAYPVPIATTFAGTLATLRNVNAALAISELVIQKGYIAGTEDEQLVASRRQWIDWLRSIRDLKAALPGVSTDLADGQTYAGEAVVVLSEEAFFPSADKFR